MGQVSQHGKEKTCHPNPLATVYWLDQFVYMDFTQCHPIFQFAQIG